MNKFGSRVKSLRLEKGLSQKELATLLNLPASSYRDLESNSTSRHLVYALPRLAALFGVSLSSLLDEGSALSAADDCRKIQELAEGIIQKIK